MCLCCCAPTILFLYDGYSCLFMFVFSQKKTVSVMVVDGIRDDPFMLEDTSIDGDWCIKHPLR